MKTIKKQNFKIKWVENIPEKLEQNCVYVSTFHQKLIHKCLCGCGEIISKNKGEFHLSFDKKKTFVKELMFSRNCPTKTKYFLGRSVANFVN